MDKLDQILQIVTENQKESQKTLADIDVHLSGLDARFERLDSRVSRLEDNVVGINTRLMGVEEKVADIPHMKEVIDQTFGKIDDFMVILNRYESEIAAIGMKYERLEDRVTTLESNHKA